MLNQIQCTYQVFLFFFTSRDGDKIVLIKTLWLVETFSLHFYQKTLSNDNIGWLNSFLNPSE